MLSPRLCQTSGCTRCACTSTNWRCREYLCVCLRGLQERGGGNGAKVRIAGARRAWPGSASQDSDLGEATGAICSCMGPKFEVWSSVKPVWAWPAMDLEFRRLVQIRALSGLVRPHIETSPLRSFGPICPTRVANLRLTSPELAPQKRA